MRTRQAYLDGERAALAPYASKASESRGRVHPEAEHPLRSPYERDRDRIVHSSAFRRLEYKTQVFVNHEGDYYRTRLTHTLEAAQIARSLARFLRLNEDLAEAVALAHDLGHPPFGHAGEQTLRHLMAEHGGFEHTRQGLRVVDRLEERYPDFPGLNLTWEVREGLAKHSKEFDPRQPLPDFVEFADAPYPSLEAQLVDICDEIAYNAHDIDDGLTAGMITLDQLERVEIWSRVRRQPEQPAHLSPEQIKYLGVRALINAQVDDLLHAVEARAAEWGLASAADVRRAPGRVAVPSEAMQGLAAELREFLHTEVYHNYRVYRMSIKARRLLEDLFRLYREEPGQLPPPVRARAASEGLERALCDYLAALTDREAIEEHRRLLDPSVTA
ncbi:MAG: deoxyguanosinetriphosphate triphosphohydrolase [Armatimonadetes bacterium]|nr:deoxyguanosinetriphosphate triphosphohydrolase [Armatimonadota bacterium]